MDWLAWNRARYTLLAPVYDRVAGFGAERRRSLALLGARAGERVLVVGCGTGSDLPFLARGVRVTAGDLTPAMVERTRRRAEALGMDAEVRVMDAHALDLPDRGFDAVVLHLVLAVVPDPLAAIREAERVLRPGGRAVVFDKWVPDDGAPSLARRLANPVARLVATDLNRRLGPLLAETSLGGGAPRARGSARPLLHHAAPPPRVGTAERRWSEEVSGRGRRSPPRRSSPRPPR